ncbi:MAG: gliding motility lipoprotein GldH [Bacteroidales bacterium]|nr:gliding motility lipoprotein GldH [Bacteroidales bacterium]
MKKYLLLFALFTTLLCGCHHNEYYGQVNMIPDEKWAIDRPQYFKLNIEDSMQYFNMYILLRNTTDFETQNFYVFMKTKYPDGHTEQDTLGFILCDKFGNWTGHGQGRLKDNKFLFQPKVRFPYNGEYTFTVTQGMRDSVVEGIESFGIVLEKWEENN